MNTGMSFLAIVSLLLAMAMAGEAVKQQTKGTSSAPTHNRAPASPLDDGVQIIVFEL